MSPATRLSAEDQDALIPVYRSKAKTFGLKEQTEVDIRARLRRSFALARGLYSLWQVALEHNPRSGN